MIELNEKELLHHPTILKVQSNALTFGSYLKRQPDWLKALTAQSDTDVNIIFHCEYEHMETSITHYYNEFGFLDMASVKKVIYEFRRYFPLGPSRRKGVYYFDDKILNLVDDIKKSSIKPISSLTEVYNFFNDVIANDLRTWWFKRQFTLQEESSFVYFRRAFVLLSKIEYLKTDIEREHANNSAYYTAELLNVTSLYTELTDILDSQEYAADDFDFLNFKSLVDKLGSLIIPIQSMVAREDEIKRLFAFAANENAGSEIGVDFSNYIEHEKREDIQKILLAEFSGARPQKILFMFFSLVDLHLVSGSITNGDTDIASSLFSTFKVKTTDANSLKSNYGSLKKNYPDHLNNQIKYKQVKNKLKKDLAMFLA